MKNPLSMLSIKNYDLICKNEEFKKIMALALQIEVSKLTEYCKDITTFSNYIDSLPKTKKEKEKAKLSPITPTEKKNETKLFIFIYLKTMF
jgi:hypothetical protein